MYFEKGFFCSLKNESPDNARATGYYKLAIYGQKGNSQRLLKIVSPGTAKAPFAYEFEDSFEKVFLHMEGGTTGGYEDNAGEVRYELTIGDNWLL